MIKMIELLINSTANSIILVIRSLIFFKTCCLLGLQALKSFFRTWLNLLKSAVKLPVDTCRIGTGWVYYLACFPLRIMTAVQREKMMEMNLRRMEVQLENLTMENKQLEYCLDASFEESRVIETVLSKMEQEQDRALEKIYLLETELQDLRDTLKETELQGKTSWDYPTLEPKDTLNETHVPSETPLQPPHLEEDEATLERRRRVALHRSTFSVLLSLLVGMIVWEAEDPCIPLVAALFTVVGMSLGSVIQFFSAIQNKPASDAVALLSFNWFVLGTLTSPSLPRLLRVLSPTLLGLARRLLRKLGFQSLF